MPRHKIWESGLNPYRQPTRERKTTNAETKLMVKG